MIKTTTTIIINDLIVKYQSAKLYTEERNEPTINIKIWSVITKACRTNVSIRQLSIGEYTRTDNIA